MNIRNPSDLRNAIEDLITVDGVARIGGVTVTRDELEEATEEIIGALVDAYLNQTRPPVCLSILGRILISAIEEQSEAS